MSLLDEECRFPKASDLTLLEKLHKNHEKDRYYEKPKRRGNNFIVRHYAGDVSYEVDFFLDKNRDTIPETVQALMQNSEMPYIRVLFSENMEAPSPAQVKRSPAQAPRGGRGGAAAARFSY